MENAQGMLCSINLDHMSLATTCEVHVVGPTRSWIISSAPFQRSNRYMLILTRQHTQKYFGMIATFDVIASLYSCTYMLASSSSGSSIKLLI